MARSDEQLKKWLERVDDRFMGSPLEVHPHEALLHCLRVTAGEVRYCDEQIRHLENVELFEKPRKSTMLVTNGRSELVEERVDSEQFSRWVQWRQSAIDRLARYSKMALEAGIDERAMRLAEQEAEQISEYLKAVLDDVDLTPAQHKRLGPAMRRHLSLIEGDAA